MRKRATYQDVLDAPEDVVAEIVNGELVLSPRPDNSACVLVSSFLGEIGTRFGREEGNWIVIYAPEVHLDDDILVPDIAAWRRERLPAVPDAAFISVAPDSVCEALSPKTRRLDRVKKLPRYATHGVAFAWLVDPKPRTLEAFRLVDGAWSLVAAHDDDDGRVRVPPFDAIELDLPALWTDVPVPSANESAYVADW